MSYLAAPLVIAGCPSDPPQCASPQAAFVVSIRAAGGPLPDDTTLRIAYGAGTEEYRLADPASTSEVVYCRVRWRDAGASEAGAVLDAAAAELDAGTPDAADTGAGSSEVDELSSELWTGGAATITVSASGYAELERDLTAEEDECGVMTTEIPLTLVGEDAGS